MGKESACNGGGGDAGDMGSIPGSGRSPGGRHGPPVGRHPTLVFLPGASQGQRILSGYSPSGLKSRAQLRYLSTHACLLR